MGGGKPFDTPRGIEIASDFITDIGGFVEPTLHKIVELILGQPFFAIIGHRFTIRIDLGADDAAGIHKPAHEPIRAEQSRRHRRKRLHMRLDIGLVALLFAIP